MRVNGSSQSGSLGKGRVFISYRRDDCPGHAGRLYDALAQRFGARQLFMDIDSIEPGEDFVAVIEKSVGSCNVLIAMIGKKWMTGADQAARRLDNPEDFVRIEIAAALGRNIRVIPVLVQGASMPLTQDLPEPLKKLARRNALEISDVHWRSGVEALVKVIDKELAGKVLPEVKAEDASVASSRERRVASADRRVSGPRTDGKTNYFTLSRVLVGVGVSLLIALVGMFGRNMLPSSTKPDDKEQLEQLISRIRSSVTPRASVSDEAVDKLPDGRLRYTYSVWIEAPAETLNQIAKVEYFYNHPDFGTPRTESRDRGSGFKDRYTGYGAVNADMDITLVLNDETRIVVKFNMYQALYGKKGS